MKIPVRSLVLCTFLSLFCRIGMGQEGEPFMNHFQLEKVPGNRVTSISEDPENTMIFSGNTGIITFDSEIWENHAVPNIPLAVASDSAYKLVYVGGRGFFGYLLKTAKGNYEYHSLSDENEDTGDIYKIYQTSSHVIFYGDELIAMSLRSELYRLRRFNADSLNVFSGILIYRDNAYVNLLGKGIHEISERGLMQVETRIDFSSSEILFGIEYGDSNALVGLDNNTIFWFNGYDFSMVELEDQEYLAESFLKDAAWLKKNVFALSTVLGGCMIVDVVTGKTVNILNYQTGLPDDEVFAIGTDKNHGLWLAHPYGLTRVDVRLPVRSFENYPGLNGNLLAVAVLDSILYVSTNEGIYFLEEKRDYLEEEIVIRISTPAPPAVKEQEALEKILEEVPMEEPKEEVVEESKSWKERRQTRQEARKARKAEKRGTSKETGEDEGSGGPSETEVTDETGETTADEKPDTAESAKPESPPGEDKPDEKKTGGLKSFFRKISGKDETEKVQKEEAALAKVQEEIPPTVSRTRYVKQKIYSLQSISHEFTRLGEFDEKAKDLVPVGGRILISTNGGLYELVNKKLRIVRPGWYVQGIFPSLDSTRIYVTTDESAFQLILKNDQWVTSRDFSYVNEEIYSVCEERDSTIWLGCDNRSYRIRPLNNAISDIRSFEFHESYYDPVIIRDIRDTVFFFLSTGIYCHDDDSIYRTNYLENRRISRLHLSTGAITWVKCFEDWISFGGQNNYNSKINSYLNLFEDVADLYLDTDGNVWVVSETNHLHKINPDKVMAYKPGFELFLKRVYNDNEFFSLDQLLFDYYDRSLVFDFAAPFYLKDNSTSYQYFAEGMSERWSDWYQSGVLSFPVLPMGKFTLHVRARNVLGQKTNIKSYSVVIKPPWWLSWPFLAAASILLVSVVFGIIRMRVRKLRRDKAILEEKVRERTVEIQRQKDEISDQKKEIMDSIHYARRIQKAVLPSDRKVEEQLPEHFIFYLPRDIVSGDFYWISSIDNRTIFAAADCTGHGVPGAFMSMLGVSFLNEIANKNKRLSAGRILDYLRTNVKETLSQSDEGSTMDGMDIALCIFDRSKMTLQYAGAHNPLYMIRNGELTEIKADFMPIGIHIVEETPFKNHTIKVEPGDCFYIFSDGFQDQFGGTDGKKFLSRSLRKMFLDIHREPMYSQKDLIDRKLQEWMKGYEQVDDIIVLGVRISEKS